VVGKPQAVIQGSVMWTTEHAKGSETRRHCNEINARFTKGKMTWDFDINDISSKKKGLVLEPNDCPTIRFELIGRSLATGSKLEDKLTRPLTPENIGIAITSFWIISPSDRKGPWLRNILDSFILAGDTQTMLSYSNLLQIVTLNPKLSELSKRVIHQATVKFKPGTVEPLEVIDDDYAVAPKSFGVKPSVVCT
jgi:hypothetical protein